MKLKPLLAIAATLATFALCARYLAARYGEAMAALEDFHA